MSLLGSAVAFVVALVIGGLAIFISASIVTGVRDYTYALVTAILGAIAWALLAWVPLLGPILALLAWVWVIKWRYPGGWVVAIVTGFVAWIAAILILMGLEAGFDIDVGAFGIPNV